MEAGNSIPGAVVYWQTTWANEEVVVVAVSLPLPREPHVQLERQPRQPRQLHWHRLPHDHAFVIRSNAPRPLPGDLPKQLEVEKTTEARKVTGEVEKLQRNGIHADERVDTEDPQVFVVPLVMEAGSRC